MILQVLFDVKANILYVYTDKLVGKGCFDQSLPSKIAH